MMCLACTGVSELAALVFERADVVVSKKGEPTGSVGDRYRKARGLAPWAC